MTQAVSRTPASLARHDLNARQTVHAACAAMAVVLVLDLADGRLGLPYSVGFVLISLTAAMAVDVRSLFVTGVLPPALLIGTLTLVAMFWPSAIQIDGLSAHAGVIGRALASIIDHGMTLVIGHGLALGVIALRILTNPSH